MIDLKFFYNKRILITGHTGFKGTWLSKILIDSEAIVCGYALKPADNSLFNKINFASKMKSIEGDIRDFEKLQSVFKEFKPEIVIHLAAQPIVINSYNNPRYTYETNVMGVVNLLECIRNSSSVISVLNVTTDKVYENDDTNNEFEEDEKLNGSDPYSNSKSCSELITSSYKKSFFDKNDIRISTARAGNVIGGGDFSDYRIIPDCVKAVKENKTINIRNPNSVRPYQHVLDALFAYLTIIQKQYENPIYAGSYNVGPEKEDITTTKELVKLFCYYWKNNANFSIENNNYYSESLYLRLNCNKIKEILGWKPVWNVEKAIKQVVEFEKLNDNFEKCMENQIKEYLKDMR